MSEVRIIDEEQTEGTEPGARPGCGFMGRRDDDDDDVVSRDFIPLIYFDLWDVHMPK